jgi:catechol 2,3-dioxygenase-like lactoylglutathione lyase family enzyme
MLDVARPTAQAGLDLPAPDQIGFVVRDLDRAIAQYEPIFGPLTVTDFGPQQASYRGARPTPYQMRFAFGRAGGLEIELIEWLEGDTPHRDFIQQGREGMHHLRYRIDDLDYWLQRVCDLGFEVTWMARLSSDVGYAYCEREGDPLVLEFLQMPVA